MPRVYRYPITETIVAHLALAFLVMAVSATGYMSTTLVPVVHGRHHPSLDPSKFAVMLWTARIWAVTGLVVATVLVLGALEQLRAVTLAWAFVTVLLTVVWIVTRDAWDPSDAMPVWIMVVVGIAIQQSLKVARTAE